MSKVAFSIKNPARFRVRSLILDDLSFWEDLDSKLGVSRRRTKRTTIIFMFTNFIKIELSSNDMRNNNNRKYKRIIEL